MIVWTFQSILREIIKYALLAIVSIVIYSYNFKRQSNSMDISDVVGGKSNLDSFIDCNFDKVEYPGFESPIFLSNVNFINKNDSLKFCTMDIQQCWVKRIDTCFAFFIVIKRTNDIRKNISAKYGGYDVTAWATSEGTPIGTGIFIWRKRQLLIYLESYLNILKTPRYEMCDLIICGNMTFDQISDIREK
jgi:hypothetical protein